MYPTAAKFVAGALFAALAWWVSGLLVPNLPLGTATGMLAPVNAMLGFVLGWHIVGMKGGKGYVQALGQGLTAALLLMVCGLLVWAGHEMLQRSLDLYYDGPTDAIEGMIGLVGDFSYFLLPGAVIPALVIGGCAIGLVTEWVARRAN